MNDERTRMNHLHINHTPIFVEFNHLLTKRIEFLCKTK